MDKAFINCVIRPFLFYRRDRKEKVRKKIFYFFLLSVKIVYAKSIHCFLSFLSMLFVYVNEGYTEFIGLIRIKLRSTERVT